MRAALTTDHDQTTDPAPTASVSQPHEAAAAGAAASWCEEEADGSGAVRSTEPERAHPLRRLQSTCTGAQVYGANDTAAPRRYVEHVTCRLSTRCVRQAPCFFAWPARRGALACLLQRACVTLLSYSPLTARQSGFSCSRAWRMRLRASNGRGGERPFVITLLVFAALFERAGTVASPPPPPPRPPSPPPLPKCVRVHRRSQPWF